MSNDQSAATPTLTLRFEPREGYLYAHASGCPITVPVALEALTRIAAECRRVGAGRVMVENGLERQLSVADMYDVARRLPAIFRGVRLAWLDRRRLDFGRVQFGEDVALIGGMNGRLFADFDEAARWLPAEPGSDGSGVPRARRPAAGVGSGSSGVATASAVPLIPLVIAGGAAGDSSRAADTVARFLQAVSQDGRLAAADYADLELLGKGGMGAVYRARDARGEAVALKTVEAAPGEDPVDAAVRFCNEIRLVARFEHPHIVAVRGIGRLPNGPLFFTMELMHGDLGRRKVPMPPAAAAEIVAAIAGAVGYAHARNVIHRDIKPKNILFTRDGVPKLADFGLAKEIDPAGAPTRAGVGTPGFMSPEQLTGRNVGKPSDVYSLGAILCWLLTGGLEPARLESAAAEPLLVETCRRCLAERPDDRPDAAGLAAELGRFSRTVR